MKQIKIGLAGNPNSGKTTIFNSLTGSRQRVGNYAGVTVEKKEGRLIHGEYELVIFDLPGTYSLTSYSMDEIVTRDFILEEEPDVIVDVLDATNIERNLYLSLQFCELGIPLVGALNIIDQAEARGIRIDTEQLSRLLGFPVIKTVGPKGKGLELVVNEIIRVYEAKQHETTPVPSRTFYPKIIELEYQALVQSLAVDQEFCKHYPAAWLASKLLEKDADARRRLQGHAQEAQVQVTLDHAIEHLEKHYNRDTEILISEQRYAYIHGAVKETVKRALNKETITERIDKVLLNRFLGLPIFLGILWLIFQATFSIGAYPQGWLESFFGWAGDSLGRVIPDGILHSLVIDGIIGGVGGVFSFVPLIVILFMFISILEDTGYMARAAFIMDKFLHVFGLHGQSFLPMMVGFGCSVPAIMAARALKSPKDRIITILVIPFMSCGAKLPVYVLLAGAFFSANASTVVLSIYLVGIALAMLSAWVFRRTVLKGENTPFVMELPPYRVPTGKGISRQVFDKSLKYFKKAGTVLLPASILIWAITTFPQAPADIAQEVNPMEYSIAGRIGKFLEPAFKPLGFDWKITIATVTGFAAKEVVVSTLGVLYSVGDDTSAESEPLRQAMQKDPVFNPLVAYCLMLFTLILAPCLAAQATIKAELGWKWLVFYIGFSIFVAWTLGLLVYQVGSLVGLGV